VLQTQAIVGKRTPLTLSPLPLTPTSLATPSPGGERLARSAAPVAGSLWSLLQLGLLEDAPEDRWSSNPSRVAALPPLPPRDLLWLLAGHVPLWPTVDETCVAGKHVSR
jgi:hypothetical protein